MWTAAVAIKKDRWASHTFAWLECTTWRAVDHSGALAHATGTTCIATLPTWNTLHCIYVCRSHWKWLSAMGIHIVRISQIELLDQRQKTMNLLLLRIHPSTLLFLLAAADVSARSLRTPSNVFVINLAFCDFLMMAKTPIFIYNSFNHGYALGSLGCQIFSLVGALSGIGAAITNACIAYDRWLVS